MLKRLILDAKGSALFRALAIFLAAGWALLQIADAFIDNGILPAWTFKAVLVLLLIGLPIILATAVLQNVMRTATAANRLFTWRNALIGGVVAFTLLAVVAGGWMGMRALGVGSIGTLAAKGVLKQGAPVVLADFNSGSDEELGDVVTRALRVDLMESRMIRVIDRAELNAPLERMQAQRDARITNELAMQLAEREGYAAIITGDVAKAGSGYVLTASIRAGAGFLPVAAFRETARGEDNLIDAIEKLSRAIRDKAGESLRTVQGGASLAQVTTSSLPALRAYTRGEAKNTTGDYAGALEHYEQAVVLDSTFAMAHRKIATILGNLNIRRPDVVRAYHRAYQLRERLPELERQLAAAAYFYRVVGDVDATTRAYEQALAIDSLNGTVRNNLAAAYIDVGRYDDAAQLFSAAVRTRPTATIWGNLASTRMNMGDFAGALATVDSGMAALPAWNDGYYVKASMFATRLDVAAADSLRRVLEQNAKTPLERENSRWLQVQLGAMRGRLREAERVLDGPAELDLADPIMNAGVRAQLLIMRGDTAGAIRAVKDALAKNKAEDDGFGEAVFALATAGAGDAANIVLADWRAATPDDQLGFPGRAVRDLATGVTQRARRDFQGALRTLQDLDRRCPGCNPARLYAIAQTYDEMGQAGRAIEAYERALTPTDPAALYMAPAMMRAVLRLGELYDAQGNTAKAVEYYARFTNLWRDADPELQPIVRRAQQRLQVLSAGSRR